MYLDVRDDSEEAKYDQHVEQPAHLPQRQQAFMGRVPVTQTPHAPTHTHKETHTLVKQLT